MERRTDGGTPWVRAIPWVRGGLVGACAFLAGMAIVGGLLVVDVAVGNATVGGAGGGGTLDDGPGLASVFSWIYLEAHFVDVLLFWPPGPEPIALLGSLSGGAVPRPVYHLVPALVTAGAGYGLAARTGGDGRALDAAAGASIACGYAVAAVAVSRLLAWSVYDGTIRVAASLPETLVIAGLVYPLALGALGGIVASAVGSPARGPDRPRA